MRPDLFCLAKDRFNREHCDVTGSPYQVFAGHDASRGLATMAMKVKDTHDDLSDLSDIQLQSLKSWEATFTGGPSLMAG